MSLGISTFYCKSKQGNKNVKTTLHSNFEKLKNTATLLFKMGQEQPLVHRDCDCIVLGMTILTEHTVPKCNNSPHMTTINT
jgi:hypothetical protein